MRPNSHLCEYPAFSWSCTIAANSHDDACREEGTYNKSHVTDKPLQFMNGLQPTTTLYVPDLSGTSGRAASQPQLAPTHHDPYVPDLSGTLLDVPTILARLMTISVNLTTPSSTLAPKPNPKLAAEPL